MSPTPEHALFEKFKKARGQFVRRIASPGEYVNKCLLLLAESEVFPHAVPKIWETLHDSCREEFTINIRAALATHFLFRPLLFGVPTCTPEEYRRLTEQRTRRLREWSIAILNYLNQTNNAT